MKEKLFIPDRMLSEEIAKGIELEMKKKRSCRKQEKILKKRNFDLVGYETAIQSEEFFARQLEVQLKRINFLKESLRDMGVRLTGSMRDQ